MGDAWMRRAIIVVREAVMFSAFSLLVAPYCFIVLVPLNLLLIGFVSSPDKSGEDIILGALLIAAFMTFKGYLEGNRLFGFRNIRGVSRYLLKFSPVFIFVTATLMSLWLIVNGQEAILIFKNGYVLAGTALGAYLLGGVVKDEVEGRIKSRLARLLLVLLGVLIGGYLGFLIPAMILGAVCGFVRANILESSLELFPIGPVEAIRAISGVYHAAALFSLLTAYTYTFTGAFAFIERFKEEELAREQLVKYINKTYTRYLRKLLRHTPKSHVKFREEIMRRLREREEVGIEEKLEFLLERRQIPFMERKGDEVLIKESVLWEAGLKPEIDSMKSLARVLDGERRDDVVVVGFQKLASFLNPQE